MAITINQQPQTFSPVYNPLVFVVDSDNNNQANFQYVFDVYFDGVFQTRHRLPARPVTGEGVFDASRIIEASVTHDIDLNYGALGFSANNNSFKKFYISFGEEYGSTVTLYPDLETSDDIYAFNGAIDYFDFVDYDKDDYLLSSSSKKFLTNSPAQNIRTTERAWVYSVCDVPSNYTHINIRVFDSAGTVLTTINFGNSITLATDKFIRWMLDMPVLDALYPGYFIDGNYIEVYAVNGLTTISESKRFYITDECTKYDIYRLHFLNKLGGVDSFSFTLVSKKETSIKKSKYKRTLGTLTGGQYLYSKSDRSEHTLSTASDDTISIKSNWINEDQSIWLKELVESPIVFQEVNGELIPITINDTRYETKKVINDKLFNLSLSFNYSVTNYRQRY